MTREVNSAFARALVAGWVGAGVTDVVIAPGSRSAPLVYAVAAEARLARHVVLDERAAAFVALGLGRATGRPAVVVTTSGTATANLHPAVLEAHHGFVPLILATADRPPELRDTGAPQTIDQRNLFGVAVRWYAAPPVPVDDPERVGAWHAVGAQSVIEATGARPGPVHLNLAFAEPLVPNADSLVVAPSAIPDTAPVTEPGSAPSARLDAVAVDRLAAEIAAEPHGLVLAGWGHGVSAVTMARFSTAAGWSVVADLLSGLGALPTAIPRVEALLRTTTFPDAHAPRLALRVGAPLTSSTVLRGLERVGTETRLIDATARWRAPVYGAASVIAADPEWLLCELADRLEADAPPRTEWLAAWAEANDRAQRAIDATLDSWSECSEPRVARDVLRAVPVGAAVLVASSMPVRDVEWFAPPRADITVHANRGVNGIDGFVATAVGIARGHDGPVVALSGDLSFLHDGGGRLAAPATANLTIVVIDNDGGGIFSFLPQADGPDGFEELFGTPPAVDVAAIARAHGLVTTVVESAGAVSAAVADAIASPVAAVVVVRTDRARNVDHHAQVWSAVGQALT